MVEGVNEGGALSSKLSAGLGSAGNSNFRDFLSRRKWYFIISGIVILALVFWFLFFTYHDCETDWDCFNSNLESCSRAKLIGGEEMIFEYKIKGKSENVCEVNVELLQGELNNQESRKLEGREMTCMIPIGVVIIPESDINECSGYLKEGLQELIIKRLHMNIVQNLGKINLEIAETP